MQRRESSARNHQRPRSLTVEQLEPRICLAAGSAVHARPSRAAAVGIDHTPPMIVAARVPVGRPVPAGQTLPISLRFSETVRLAGLNDQKPPTLRIDFGFYAFDAPYAQGSGTRELTFALAVPAGLAGRIVGAGPISLPDGTSLSDSAGNAAVRELPAAAIRAIGRAVVDGMSPDIITIGKPTPAPYGRGTTIVVRMSEPVVVAGSPTLRSIIGGVERSFVYSGGTGTDRLTFTCSALRTVGIDRITTEPAIRIGPGRSIRDRNGNAYGPVPIPTEALASTYFADHCRQVIASDGVLDVFLQMKAETITVGGGRYSSQDVVTVAMPESVPGFLQDTFTLLDPLLSLDYRLTSDRSRADVIIWIDSAISVENLVDPLGITIDNVSEGRAWWEIGLNGPLLQNSIALLNYVILHELGHAQGLEHTFDDYDDDFYIGTNIDTNAYADDTVMSYRGSRSGRLPAWYTQNDLAALRSIWGSESMSAAQTSGPRETRAGR